MELEDQNISLKSIQKQKEQLAENLTLTPKKIWISLPNEKKNLFRSKRKKHKKR
jgi:hypothetical protein